MKGPVLPQDWTRDASAWLIATAFVRRHPSLLWTYRQRSLAWPVLRSMGRHATYTVFFMLPPVALMVWLSLYGLSTWGCVQLLSPFLLVWFMVSAFLAWHHQFAEAVGQDLDDPGSFYDHAVDWIAPRQRAALARDLLHVMPVAAPAARRRRL